MRSMWMVLVVAVAVAACGGGTGSITEFEESPTSIDLDVAAGNLTIVGNASIGGASIQADIREGDPEPAYDLVGGVLTVSDNCTPDTDCRVDYIVSIAGDADVTVLTASGNVAVTELAGAVTVDAMDGNVSLTAITGDIQVAIGTGGVLGTRLESALASFETGRGDLDVTFDEPVATLVVASEDGDVTVQLPDAAYTFDTSAPNGSVDNLLDNDPAASNTISLSSANGNITVYRR
jgi:hypothetical protein